MKIEKVDTSLLISDYDKMHFLGDPSFGMLPEGRSNSCGLNDVELNMHQAEVWSERVGDNDCVVVLGDLIKMHPFPYPNSDKDSFVGYESLKHLLSNITGFIILLVPMSEYTFYKKILYIAEQFLCDEMKNRIYLECINPNEFNFYILGVHEPHIYHVGNIPEQRSIQLITTLREFSYDKVQINISADSSFNDSFGPTCLSDINRIARLKI